MSGLGNCKKIKEVIKLVKNEAKVDIAVLIHGESGTGKELVAQAIHQQGQRAKQAFVAIDSGAIPEAKEKVEEEMLLHRLEKYNGNLSKVSKSMGVSKSTIYDLMEKLDLDYQKRKNG